MNFSKQQLDAINHKEGPALVLAVPGAGKTTVLLERINSLIDSGVNPRNILAMTFSRNQALDMSDRFTSKYGHRSVTFSTIHSFAYGIVRSYANKNNTQINLIESSKEFNKYRLIERIFYDINKKPINDEELEEFFRISGFMKNTLQDYKTYSKKYPTSFRNFELLYKHYEDFKKEQNLIDFDDMLLLALQIISTDKEILGYLQNQFKYIQIDEGQDTSLIQLKIIYMIAQPEDNIFIVADDDQSIYGFRGASPNELLNFKSVYPKAKIFLMENNYRSSKNIVDLSSKIINHNTVRYDKNLQSTKEEKNKINLIRAKNSRIQTNYIVKEILDKGKDRTIAVLYRNNISSINIINALSGKTDFYIKDGKFAFYDHFIIRDVINMINFSYDQTDIDLFEKIYYKFNLYLKKDFINQIKIMDHRSNIVDRLEDCDGVYTFYQEKFELLRYYLYQLRYLDVDDAIKFIFSNIGYYEYLKEYARRSKTPILTYDRVIDTLINISRGCKTVKDLEDKFNELNRAQKEASQAKSNITLSTIHGSKGLEYDNVYLIDLIDEEFPSAYSMDENEDVGVLEEERRLFYVAVTRAKENLSLVTLKRLNNRKVEPSLFLKELK